MIKLINSICEMFKKQTFIMPLIPTLKSRNCRTRIQGVPLEIFYKVYDTIKICILVP